MLADGIDVVTIAALSRQDARGSRRFDAGHLPDALQQHFVEGGELCLRPDMPRLTEAHGEHIMCGAAQIRGAHGAIALHAAVRLR